MRYHLSTPGFRTREITLVTTLLDTEVYSVPDLAELYRQRWQVETSLAHLGLTGGNVRYHQISSIPLPYGGL